MKVTQPMIERGIQAIPETWRSPLSDPRPLVEAVLRGALNDPDEPVAQIPGQMSVDDFPEAFGDGGGG